MILRRYWLSFLLLGLLFFSLLGLGTWAFFGEMEESVSGSGQIVPEQGYRTVRAPVSGVIVSVHVADNDTVNEQQVLFEIDPSLNNVDKRHYSKELALLQKQSAAMEQALRERNAQQINETQDAWLTATRRAHEAELQALEMTIEQNRHLLNEAKAERAKLSTLLTRKQSRLNDYKELAELGGIAKRELQEFQDELTRTQGDIAQLDEAIQAKTLAIKQAEQQLTHVQNEFEQNVLERLQVTEKEMVTYSHNVQKTELTNELRIIKSPVNGTVHEQNIVGKGDVVQAGDVLATLVPKDSEYVAEIKLSNQDFSFMRPGQQAAMRLEAFPFQEYGRLFGNVSAISPSTVQDQNEKQPHYLIRVTPDQQYVEKEGKRLELRAGMTVSADIITRKKSVLTLLTEPLQIKMDRAFRDPSSRG